MRRGKETTSAEAPSGGCRAHGGGFFKRLSSFVHLHSLSKNNLRLTINDLERKAIFPPGRKRGLILPAVLLALLSCQRPFLDHYNQLATDRPGESCLTAFPDADLKLPLAVVNEKNLRGTAVGAFISLGRQCAFVTANGYFYTMDKEGFNKAASTRPAKGISTAPVYKNGRLYIAAEWDKTGLSVYDFAQQKTVRKLDGAFSVSTPIIYKNRIFHAQKNGFIGCFNAKTLRKIWQTDIQDQIRNSLAFDGEFIFSASLSGKIIALVPESGSIVWQTELRETVRAAPLVSSSFLIVATVSGKLFLLDKGTGKIKKTTDLHQPLFSTPSLHGKRLYLGGSGGGFFAYDLKQDSLLWSKQLEGALTVPALILKDKIVVGTSRRRLYILNKKNGTILQQMELDGRLSALPLPYAQGLILGYEYKKLAFLKNRVTK